MNKNLSLPGVSVVTLMDKTHRTDKRVPRLYGREDTLDETWTFRRFFFCKKIEFYTFFHKFLWREREGEVGMKDSHPM